MAKTSKSGGKESQPPPHKRRASAPPEARPRKNCLEGQGRRFYNIVEGVAAPLPAWVLSTQPQRDRGVTDSVTIFPNREEVVSRGPSESKAASEDGKGERSLTGEAEERRPS
jgi:hypothetical protein